MRSLLIASLLIAALAAGCGTTQIVTAEPTARIFVDGRAVGQGHATIDKRGTPGSARVLVKTDDGRQQQSTIERSFTAVTLLGGLVTYGVCLVACWEYPDTVFVPLPEAPRTPAAPPPPLATAAADPWLTPPPDWHPRRHEAPAADEQPKPAGDYAGPAAW